MIAKIKKVQKYAEFFQEIKDRVREAQLAALRAVNQELVKLYWGYWQTYS